jgi:hypothetical protein
MGHENDLHYVDLARFAVSEYNKKAVSPQPRLSRMAIFVSLN